MSEYERSTIGKIILMVLLMVASMVVLYEVNVYFGAYLDFPLWTLIMAVTGIFDIAVFYRITQPRLRR